MAASGSSSSRPTRPIRRDFSSGFATRSGGRRGARRLTRHQVSPLAWLTGDEDDARAEASEAAERTAEALQGKAAVEVDRTSQSTDAAENVRDALRQFQPDEIVVVADGQGTWLDEDAVQEALAAPGVPVRRIESAVSS